jgi:predicted mannosyl-3-phosphoglycerate phosphatase (HAD superfamily)
MIPFGQGQSGGCHWSGLRRDRAHRSKVRKTLSAILALGSENRLRSCNPMMSRRIHRRKYRVYGASRKYSVFGACQAAASWVTPA